MDKLTVTIVKQYLPCRCELNTIERCYHSLRLGVKDLHSIDLITKQLYSERIRTNGDFIINVVKSCAGRIYVNDAASLCKLSRAIHKLLANVSRKCQLFTKFTYIKSGFFKINHGHR